MNQDKRPDGVGSFTLINGQRVRTETLTSNTPQSADAEQPTTADQAGAGSAPAPEETEK